MTQTPSISVVMGCFNQKEALAQVLPHYAHQTLSSDLFEVIVVDSTSTDGTTEFLSTFSDRFSFTHIVHPNKGKAAARNVGVSSARGKYIIITDADMIPDPRFIQAHLDAHLTSTRPSCFEGLAWNMSRLTWPAPPSILSPQVGTHPRHLSPLGWYYFLTGNLSFPKALFEAFNGFDETFTGYGWEDLELGYRLTQTNVPFYYLRTAINFHYHVISTRDEIPRCFDKGRSARIMLAKHPELKLFLGLNPLSEFIFPRISETGLFYQWMKQLSTHSNSMISRFSIWFLKEHQYIKGILSQS